MKILLLFLSISLSLGGLLSAQNSIVTYAGSTAKECFYDVVQLSDGSFLVAGYAEDLSWVPGSAGITQLPDPGLSNAQGTNRIAFLMQLDASLSNVLHVVYLPQGAAEDIRFIKQNTILGQAADRVYISGTTNDTRANGGGYFIALLNDNFVDGTPTACAWAYNVFAEGYVKERQPWDVSGDGKVTFALGQSHAYDWAAIHRLDANGQREVVPQWRTHWIPGGGEFRDIAQNYPNGGADSLDYSGIVLKESGRCDLRSWSQADYDMALPDGNGGSKKGKWPLDVFYNGYCDYGSVSTSGPGYSGYSQGNTPVHGAMSIAVDRRTGNAYIGMNVKSVLPGGNPDFEPAVIAFDADGGLLWWSRLYHEITPAGDTVNSSPDQYIDALGIDYSQGASDAFLVVNARCHGNNVENLWEGNTIAANPGAAGFQNRFTGTSGNIHIAWLGKLKLDDGTLFHSTYVAEYAEGTGSFGAAHPDPNLDGWPNPNGGWPNVNTTRLAVNNLKVTMDGSVCVLGKGRRTITTQNAYQKMVKPGNGGLSSWNSFVRVYSPDLHHPLYSSLVVGAWDTLTQQGGDNTELYGIFKTSQGVVAVGMHKEDGNNPGQPKGNDIPTTNVPAWGAAAPSGQSAVLVYYPADSLLNPADDPTVLASANAAAAPLQVQLYPNPNKGTFRVDLQDAGPALVEMRDLQGRLLRSWQVEGGSAELRAGSLAAGIYLVQVQQGGRRAFRRMAVQ